MLVRKDRGKFWDLLVALLCNFEAGIVKTGYAWKDWPDNPILDERVCIFLHLSNIEI
jgi:hypothetical protein